MSNAVGALSSLLMSLPLVAVPCLAVFGLPSIGPATAEAETDESVALGVTDELGAASSSPAGGGFPPIVDAGQAPTGPEETIVVADRSQADLMSDHRGAAANRAVGLDEATKPAPPVTPTAFSPDVFAVKESAPPVEKPPTAAPSAAWGDTVSKLNTLGIRDFHLTNGVRPGGFHFSCALHEPDRNVTRRFEAEAESADAAAGDVLAQVEQWLGTR